MKEEYEKLIAEHDALLGLLAQINKGMPSKLKPRWERLIDRALDERARLVKLRDEWK